MTTKGEISATNITNSHYQAIGLVAANWAALEAIVSSSIWQIGSIPDEIGACITSQIYTFDGRIKALCSILEVRGDFKDTIKKLNKFHDSAKSTSAFRNRILHDPWIHDANTNLPHRLEITADKKPRLEYVAVSTETLIEKAGEIADLIDLFGTIIEPALKRYPPLPIEPKT